MPLTFQTEPVRLLTANAALLVTDSIVFANAATALVLTIFGATGNFGKVLHLKNIGTANVTLDTGNTSLIETANTYLLPPTPKGQSVTVASDGVQWWLVPNYVVLPTLQVAGLSTLTGNVTLSGFANVAQTLNVAGISQQTGNATFGGFVNVAGLSTLTGNVTFSGFANIAASLNVGTTSHLVGALTVDANTTLTGNVTVNGARHFANGQLRCDTTNGRLVLPVGTNLWAT